MASLGIVFAGRFEPSKIVTQVDILASIEGHVACGAEEARRL
jgi:hypothetical protein